MRSPSDNDWLICSSTLLTASSTSLAARWRCRWARASINSDLVIAMECRIACACQKNAHRRRCAHVLPWTRASRPASMQTASAVELLLEQRTQLGRAAAGTLVFLQRALQLVLVLCADRE